MTGASPDRWMTELGSLLQGTRNGPAGGTSLAATPDECTDDQLAKRRLGIAGSLFAALAVQARDHRRPLDARGLDLLGLGGAAGLRRAPAASNWKSPRCCTTSASSARPITCC